MPNANTQYIEITNGGLPKSRGTLLAFEEETGLIRHYREMDDKNGLRFTQGLATRVNDPRPRAVGECQCPPVQSCCFRGLSQAATQHHDTNPILLKLELTELRAVRVRLSLDDLSPDYFAIDTK